MKCWHCKAELIWGGDEDGDDQEYDMVESFVLVFYKEPTDEDEGA
jgi:hypothetical protein